MFQNIASFTLFFVVSLSVTSATLCDHNMVVYQRDGSLTSTEVSNINAMVSTLQGAGTNMCWNGTQTSSQSSLLSLVNSGAFDVLLALNPSNSYSIWSASTMVGLTSALETGLLKRLAVFDRYARNTINVEGLNGMIVQDYSSTISPIIPGVPPSTGPAGEVGTWSGNFAGHGQVSCIDYTTFLQSHPESKSYYVNDNGKSVLIDYCLGSGRVVYSTTPMDFYLRGSGTDGGKADQYFANVMDQLVNLDCGPTCALRYRMLYAHSKTQSSYRALRLNGGEDDTCEEIGSSHHHVGVGPEKETHSVRLFLNNDCTGVSEDLVCDPWMDYASMPSPDFGSCVANGTHLVVNGLPQEATHVMSGGDWSSVSVVGNSATVVCPGGSGEVSVCSGVDCDWLSELMYNLIDAGTGACNC